MEVTIFSCNENIDERCSEGIFYLLEYLYNNKIGIMYSIDDFKIYEKEVIRKLYEDEYIYSIKLKGNYNGYMNTHKEYLENTYLQYKDNYIIKGKVIEKLEKNKIRNRFFRKDIIL